MDKFASVSEVLFPTLLVGARGYAEVKRGLLMVEEWQNKSCWNRGAKWKLPGYVCKDLCSER